MGKLSQAGSPRDHYSLSFSEVTTGIAEVLDPKGLRKGMNRQELTHSRRESRHMTRRLVNNWQILIFLSKLLYKQKRKRLKHQKHSYLVTTFLFLPPCILTASVLD
jgi:hypothetical protein